MPEHINKQEILEKAKAHQGNPFGVPLIIAEIEKAEGIDIVRCRDCKYANDDGTICRYSVGRAVEPEHFCSYGERKAKK